jgi:hypothetical protein
MEMSFRFFDYFHLFFKTDGEAIPDIPITVVCCRPPLLDFMAPSAALRSAWIFSNPGNEICRFTTDSISVNIAHNDCLEAALERCTTIEAVKRDSLFFAQGKNVDRAGHTAEVEMHHICHRL